MHATATAEPLHRSTVVLTPRGRAVLAFYRWLDRVRAFEADDRAAIVALALAELEPALAF